MASLHFVIGGARSGKSAFAEQLALSRAGNGMSSRGLLKKFFSLHSLLREEWGIDETGRHGIDSPG